MQEANIIFKNNTPYSLDFDDYYFNSQDGLKECEYIYTQAFEFKEVNTFIIAELGFGIGVNFFLTLKRFLKSNINSKLFYISLENFYINANNLRNIYKKLNIYDDFKDLLEEFLKFYPIKKDGIYRFYFENAFLDLVFGNVKDSLKELDFKANVWYLDGFAPSKNQIMFDENTIKEVARLSKINASIHSFSSSSFLKNNLLKFGFEIKKIQGFKKRQMIKAYFKGFDFKDIKAYFKRPQVISKNKKVAIIGCGIAGASLAFELSLRDYEVSIFEKDKKLLSNAASGNLSGILSSLILKKSSLLGQFSELAFYEASRFYQKFLDIKPSGVMEYAYNDLMKQRFLDQINNPLFHIKNDNKAFLKNGTQINPQNIIKSLLDKSRSNIYFSHEFSSYSYENDEFNLFFKNKLSQSGFGILIFAMGADIKDFLTLKALKLSKVRGQVSHLKPFLKNIYPISSKGYICKANDDMQLIGASYDRLNYDKNPSKKDDEENIKNILEFLKDDKSLEIIGSKVAFRSYSSDRFPIIGALYDEDYYINTYKKLFWTKNKAQNDPKYINNLYISSAFGSRGFASAIIAARYICALIDNEPLGIYKNLADEIHPARFLIRELKKGFKN